MSIEPGGEPIDLGSERYELRRPLGVGGFAQVYLGFDERLAIDVAVKILDTKFARDPEVRGRFVQEARLQRAIRHPGVVTVHDIDETPTGQPYFVMDYAEGGSLQDRIDLFRDQEQSIDHEDLVRLVEGLGDALETVHNNGVVHRDLKPSNVLLAGGGNQPPDRTPSVLIEPDEIIQLSDFGLAKDLTEASGLTVGAGTHGYMAPEQASAAVVDRRADLYAATIIVAEALTGERVDPELRYSQGSIVSGSPLPEPTPPPFVHVFAQSVDIDPEKRSNDAAAWSRSLIDALDGRVSRWARLRAIPWARRSALVGTTGLVAAGAIAAITLLPGDETATEAGANSSRPSTTATATAATPETTAAPATTETTSPAVDLEKVEIIAPTSMALKEKSWFWAELPDGVTVEWSSGSSLVFDTPEVWFEASQLVPVPINVKLTTADDSLERSLLIPTVQRSPEDTACALLPLEQVNEHLGVENLTITPTDFINECVYANDDLHIALVWHRTTAAEALFRNFSTYHPAAVQLDEIGDRAVIDELEGFSVLVALDDDRPTVPNHGISLAITGTVDRAVIEALAADLLAQTADDAERFPN